VDEPGVAIDDADVDDLGVENRLDPIAHEVVHRLHLEALRQPALDVVDQCQLGRSFICLG